MLEDRRIPADIKTTVDAVIRELDRLESLGDDELARSGILLVLFLVIIDALVNNYILETYNATIGVIFAAMYCSPQGRIHELKVLKLGQVTDVYQSASSILTSDFKTSAKFGWQPILFPPLQKRALTFFLDRVRPSLEAAYPQLLHPDSHLFASSRDPTRIADTSRHMVKFFQRVLGTNLFYTSLANPLTSTYVKGVDTNSTLLRSLMTTEVHDLFLDGAIGERGREAVDFANTHSESMAANHYLMRDAERQTQEAIRVAGIVAPRAAAVQASTPQRILDGSLRSTPRPASSQQWRELQWGTAHPLYNADTIRTKWSEAEVSSCVTIFSFRSTITHIFAYS
jgi:hypothetical protein